LDEIQDDTDHGRHLFWGKRKKGSASQKIDAAMAW
jgi:hypothetical protein